MGETGFASGSAFGLASTYLLFAVAYSVKAAISVSSSLCL